MRKARNMPLNPIGDDKTMGILQMTAARERAKITRLIEDDVRALSYDTISQYRTGLIETIALIGFRDAGKRDEEGRGEPPRHSGDHNGQDS